MMKKFLLIAGIAAITVLSLSSCKKTCVCNEASSPRLQTVEISTSRGQGCSDLQLALNDNYSDYQNRQKWVCR